MSSPLTLATVASKTLAWQDYAALFVYFAANLAIGWWCSRRRQSSAGEYFLGSGRVAWWAVGISFFATAVSSISFMALPAKTYATDWLVFLSAPAQALAGMFMGVVFVGLLRRIEMTTVFLYLERRFNRNVRLLGAALGLLLKVLGRMSVVMLLPALALSTVTGLNVYLSILLMGAVTTLYACEGGFRAVIWTDVLQTGVMLGGVGIALWYVGAGVDGGLAAIIRDGEAAGKFEMVRWNLDLTQPTVWVFVGMFIATVFTQLSDQTLMQRMLAAPDPREARRTVLLGNGIALSSAALFFFLGTALWAFYRAHPERLAAGLPNDAIFPYFIANELPRGVAGLIVAGLFASGMGALSSILNSMAAIVVSDFQGTWRPGATAVQQVRLAKGVTVTCGVLGTGMAMWLAYLNVPSLWDMFLKLVALIGGSFPGVFALGLLTRRANAQGAIAGSLIGIAATWWVQQYTAASVFLHGFVAVAACFISGYLVSLLFPRPTHSLAGLTLFSRSDSPRTDAASAVTPCDTAKP